MKLLLLISFFLFSFSVIASQPFSITASQLSVVTAATADNVMSYNAYEGNPLFRGGDGRYQIGKGVAVDIGLIIPMILAEHWLVKKYPKAKKLKWGIVIGNEAVSWQRFDAAFRR